MLCFDPSAFVRGEIQIVLTFFFSFKERNTSVLDDSFYSLWTILYVMLHIPEHAVENLCLLHLCPVSVLISLRKTLRTRIEFLTWRPGTSNASQKSFEDE